MLYRIYFVFVMVSLLLTAVSVAIAQGAPDAITYQGKLVNSSGQAVADGNYQATISFHDAPEGGTSLWSSGAISVATTGGVFATLLQPVSSGVFSGPDVWLQVEVEGTVLMPRVKFASVPYAFRAREAVNAWSLTGNSGTDPTTHFLGTTDGQGLEIKVNNARAFRIEPSYPPNLIGGYSGNLVTSGVIGATIAGGGSLGQINRVTDNYGVIGGGVGNQAGDNAGATSDKYCATVAGGRSNIASGTNATVGGGYSNTSSGQGSTVAGGYSNSATGLYSIVLGGRANQALADYGFAAGLRAKASHHGAFVWADATDANLASTADNQFMIRASGGVRFFSNSATTAGVELAPGSGAWSSVSDRNLKANFAAVDVREILQRLVSIPVQTWNYVSQEPTIRHLGPTAQDFAAAFAVGEDDKSISTIDADGVALAAIQGLYQLLQEKDAQIAELQSKMAAIDEIKAELAALKAQQLQR